MQLLGDLQQLPLAAAVAVALAEALALALPLPRSLALALTCSNSHCATPSGMAASWLPAASRLRSFFSEEMASGSWLGLGLGLGLGLRG